MADVIVYSTEWCPWCKKLKAYLDEKGVKYIPKDVGADQAAADEMIKKSGQTGVPVSDINGTIIIGFDKDAIDKALSS